MNKFQNIKDNSILKYLLFLFGVHSPITTDDTAKCVGRTSKELCDREGQHLGESKHKQRWRVCH